MKLSMIHAVTLGLLLSASCTNNEQKSGASKNDPVQDSSRSEKYACPMHPQVTYSKPGACPICGMDLVIVGATGSSTLMLTDSQIKLANITTQKVATMAVGQTILINGRISVNEDLSEIISSRASGRIERLYLKETGRAVRKGEPLYEFYSEILLTLQREYLVAKEQSESFGKEEPRYESFRSAAEQKLLRYGLTKNQIENLGQSKTSQDRITILSPASGIISEMAVSEGQYVGEGTLLYRIENLNKVWLEAELYPGETGNVKMGEKINVRITGFENTPIVAKVVFFSPEYKSNTQIILMRAVVENPELKFKPGMQAQVVFTRSLKNALAIPSDAVIRDEKGAHVYVQSDHNTFEPRRVKMGIENIDQVEIMEGLMEGEQVAVTGAYLLYSELVLKKGTDPMAEHSTHSH